MAIILEGPDAAGKTTLGRLLAKGFGFELIMSGGAPRTQTEVVQYCEMQLSHCQRRDVIIDRITPISHPIYNPVYRDSALLRGFLNAMVGTDGFLVIYCRPPTEALMRPEKHQWKDYDHEAHKQKILANQMEYIRLYDEAFLSIPHLPYDYTLNEEDYNLELISMLAASKDSDDVLRQLRTLQATQVQRRGLSGGLS